MAKRDTYKYQFKVGNKIMHGGITNDLDRREDEHKQTWPKGHIVKVLSPTGEWIPVASKRISAMLPSCTR